MDANTSIQYQQRQTKTIPELTETQQEVLSDLNRYVIKIKIYIEKWQDLQLQTSEISIYDSSNLPTEEEQEYMKAVLLEADKLGMAELENQIHHLQDNAQSLIDIHLTTSDTYFRRNLQLMAKLVSQQSESGFFPEFQAQPTSEKLSKTEVKTILKNHLNIICQGSGEIEELLFLAKKFVPIKENEGIEIIKDRIKCNSLPWQNACQLYDDINKRFTEAKQLIKKSHTIFDSEFNHELDELEKLLDQVLLSKERNTIDEIKKLCDANLQQLFDAFTLCYIYINHNANLDTEGIATVIKELVTTLLTDPDSKKGDLNSSYSLNCLQSFLGRLKNIDNELVINSLFSLALVHIENGITSLKIEKEREAIWKERKNKSDSSWFGFDSQSEKEYTRDLSVTSSAYYGALAISYFFACKVLGNTESLFKLAEIAVKKEFLLPVSETEEERRKLDFASQFETKAVKTKDGEALYKLGCLHKDTFNLLDAQRCFDKAGFTFKCDKAIQVCGQMHDESYLTKVEQHAIAKKDFIKLCEIGLFRQLFINTCYFQKAEEIAEKNNYHDLVELSKWYKTHGKNYDALQCLDKAEKIAVKRPDVNFLIELATVSIKEFNNRQCTESFILSAETTAINTKNFEQLFNLAKWHVDNNFSYRLLDSFKKNVKEISIKENNYAFLFELVKLFKKNKLGSGVLIYQAKHLAEKAKDASFLFELGKWSQLNDSDPFEGSDYFLNTCLTKAESIAKKTDNANCLFQMGKWYKLNQADKDAARCMIAAAQLNHEEAKEKCEHYKIDIPKQEFCIQQ